MRTKLIAILFFLPTVLCFSENEPALRVGHILINRKNVFQTGGDYEKKFPFALANKIHIVTRERFIREMILFKEGDPFNPDIAFESERLLRSIPIFRAVTVEARPPLNGVVDININTEDVWSTNLNVGYGQAGGKNFYQVGVFEQNLFGEGKRAGAFIKQDIDRFIKGGSYFDPNLMGTRLEFFAGYGRDEKGIEWETRIRKPFYSALVRHSEGAVVSVSQDEDRLFENGDEAATFHHDEKTKRAFFAVSLKPSLTHARRVSMIYESNENRFSDLHLSPGIAPPRDRDVKAVMGGFDTQDRRFIKERGVTTFDRLEDINLGWEWTSEAGPYTKGLGSTRNGVMGRTRLNKTWKVGQRSLWLNELMATSRREDGALKNSILRINSRFSVLEWRPDNTASARMEVVLGRTLDEETQFLLGGENGLRAYSVRRFNGSKKILFNLENRQVVAYDLLHLVNFGWAVFTDIGGIWKEHRSLSHDDFKSDVGAGLRFAPSRSIDPGLIRADVAYGLNANGGRSRWAINIGADFSFNLTKEKKFDQ